MDTSTHLLVSNLTNDNVGLSLPKKSDSQTLLSSVNGGKSVQSIAQAEQLSPSVIAYVSAAVADNTRLAYRGDLADFLAWGGSVPSTPQMLASYIACRAEIHSPYTISRRVVGISRAHVSQGLADPAKNDLVRTVLRGVRRLNGAAQRQVAPVLRQDLLAMLPLMHGTKGVRDRALILLGFAGALRRSELVALDVQDIQFVKQGLVIHQQRSKTDPHGEGRQIAVPWGRTVACPVKAVEQWLEHAGIVSGAIFRSVNKSGEIGERLTAQSVALVLKSYAEASGLDAREISGHSLRSGLVTSAVQARVAIHKIQKQTGHRSAEMLARYIRDASVFVGNAAGAVL